jgi:Flp pilus assembly protein TadB
MEEIEVPTEKLQEEIHEHAHHAREHWVSWVALSSALLAGFAAVTALLAGDHANEAMIDQIHASDHWSYYQAKGIKSAVLSTKIETLKALGHESSEKDQEKLGEYKKEQDEISEQAKEEESASRSHLRHHVIYARGVTLFQVAIAVAAISVLTRRRRFFAVGLIFGAAGLVFLIQGLLLPM